MKDSPRDKASTPFPAADANVHFCLNLSPKAAYNHKRKWVITLAYDLFAPKTLQHIMLEKSLGLRIKAYPKPTKLPDGGFYACKRDIFPDNKKRMD
ncbi:hypothetical protein [Phytobacter sp. V91]|uniref:hypothetical protein n=1 Tax=Phytobacter sp. V91 TaxID=3369425 RepID=UPI003F62C7A7